MVKVLQERGNSIAVRKAMAAEHLLAGRVDEAIKVYSDLLAEVPGDVSVCLALGDLYHRVRDDKLAILMYARAARLAPQDETIRERMQRLDLPGYLAPVRTSQPIPNEPEAVAGMLQEMTRRPAPVAEDEIEAAAGLLQRILRSPEPAAVVADNLDVIDALLPALIELNIRQARADGQNDVAAALEELRLHVNLQLEQRGVVGGVEPAWASEAAVSAKDGPRVTVIAQGDELEGRMALAVEALSSLGCAVEIAGGETIDLSNKPDLALVSNPHVSAAMLTKMALFAAAGVPVIHDLDQDFEEMPSNHPAYQRVGLGNLDNARAYMAGLTMAKLLTVPSTAMAAAVSLARCPVRVVPDGWSQKNPLWKKPSLRRATINLGWVGATGQLEDVSIIRRTIPRIMREFLQTQLVIVGDVEAYQLFDSVPDTRKIFLPLPVMEDYPFMLSQIDVLMVPLRNIPFNRVQSDRLLMEAGVRQIPWVATAIPAYQAWNDGGLLVENADDWYMRLREIVESEELRKNLGIAGAQKAQERELAQLAAAWQGVIREVLGTAPEDPTRPFMDE